MWWAWYVTPTFRDRIGEWGGTENLRTPRTTHKTRSSSKKEVKREKAVKSISGNLSGTPSLEGQGLGERGVRESYRMGEACCLGTSFLMLISLTIHKHFL